MTKFAWLCHTINASFDPGKVLGGVRITCETHELPSVIKEMVRLMMIHEIDSLVLDGVEILRDRR